MDDLYANWARVYDYFYPDRSDEVDFWTQLATPCAGQVLDLMCGTAEVSLELARRGFHVLGVDLSPAMLAVAAWRLAAAADYPARNLSLVLGNACAIPVPDASFGFALVGGNGSFNHLDDDLALIALRELGRVLRPGGRVGMELLNPYLLKEIFPERTFGPLRPTPPGVWLEKRSSGRYDRKAGRFHIRQVTHYEMDGEQGEFVESFALRFWRTDEIRLLLREAGFGAVRFYGDYGLATFDRWSADLLVVASRSPTS
jgi:SAM-dependent methyltransferase